MPVLVEHIITWSKNACLVSLSFLEHSQHHMQPENHLLNLFLTFLFPLLFSVFRSFVVPPDTMLLMRCGPRCMPIALNTWQKRHQTMVEVFTRQVRAAQSLLMIIAW